MLLFIVALAKKKGVLDDYYQSRLEVIDFYTKLSKKIAKLRLRGISQWKPKHFKIMYAIQNGTLIPPDMLVNSIMNPLAYPGVNGSLSLGSGRARQRGIFNPHYLFEQTRPAQTGGFKAGGEDPFRLGFGAFEPNGLVRDTFGGGFDLMNLPVAPNPI